MWCCGERTRVGDLGAQPVSCGSKHPCPCPCPNTHDHGHVLPLSSFCSLFYIPLYGAAAPDMSPLSRNVPVVSNVTMNVMFMVMSSTMSLPMMCVRWCMSEHFNIHSVPATQGMLGSDADDKSIAQIHHESEIERLLSSILQATAHCPM